MTYQLTDPDPFDARDRFIERLEDEARVMHEDEHEYLDPECPYCADEMAERASVVR